MTSGPFLTAIVALQLVCAALVLWAIVVSVFGLTPISWALYEVIELGAAFGLILGSVLGIVMLRRMHRRASRVESQLRAASGAFMELLQDRFDGWGLTHAERDVALFSIKGMSLAEIASLRDTSEGTVKAQTNAIYRKAGVSGRPQLLSLFIDDLIEGAIEPAKDSPSEGSVQDPLSDKA